MPISDAELKKLYQAYLEKQKLIERRYGKVRPLIHTNFQGYKFVAVGSELHYSQTWKTFPDFLLYYIKKVLGSEWGNSELAKPFDQRHQILKWYDGTCRFQREQEKASDGLYCAVPNGVMAAYLFLAYDLYILRHHTVLQARLVDRLKHQDQFQGARYELFAVATCIRAGFEIEFEDETDVTQKHPEFLATHKITGQTLSVEAKSRHRHGILGFSGGRESDSALKAGVGSLLRDAFLKPTNHPYAIFLDINLPPYPGKIFEKPWFKEIMATIDRVSSRDEKGVDPFNIIVFTNHPHHYGNESDSDPEKATLSVISQHPRIPIKQPQLIFDLQKAAVQYGNIPNEFPDM